MAAWSASLTVCTWSGRKRHAVQGSSANLATTIVHTSIWRRWCREYITQSRFARSLPHRLNFVTARDANSVEEIMIELTARSYDGVARNEWEDNDAKAAR